MWKKFKKMVVLGAMGLLIMGVDVTAETSQEIIVETNEIPELVYVCPGDGIDGYFEVWESNDFEYSLWPNGEAIIEKANDGINGHIEIPAVVSAAGKKYTVIRVDIRNCVEPFSVTIPEGVRHINFSGSSGLTSVSIPKSVTSIDGLSFSGCSSLESIIIPEGVMSIGMRAFLDCSSLASVVISESVTSIENSAFEGTPFLEKTLEESDIFVVNGLLLDVNLSISGKIDIPETVKVIESYAFDGCSNLTSITIPNSVTRIGYGAFRDCDSLRSMVIPESVTEIGNCAFEGCSSLDSIRLLEGSEVVLSKYHFNNYKHNWKGDKGFQEDFPSLVISYPMNTQSYFEDIATKKIYVENGMRYKIVSSKTVSFLGMTEEKEKKAKKIVIPNTVAIAAKNKTYRVEYVAENALKDNQKIRKVTIGKNIKQIKKNAFQNCTSLKKVILKSKKVRFIARDSFANTHKKIKVKVPKSKLTKYKKLFQYFPGLSKKAKIVKGV